jgi:hypothetical protein
MLTGGRGIRFLRNIAIILGLWYAGGVVGSIAGLVMNQLPPYVASSTRPGSLVVLRVIWVIPFAVGAFVSGFGTPWLVASERWIPWAVALGVIMLSQYGSHFTGGWRPGDLEAADRIAWPINSAVLALFFTLGVLVGWRYRRAKEAAV